MFSACGGRKYHEPGSGRRVMPDAEGNREALEPLERGVGCSAGWEEGCPRNCQPGRHGLRAPETVQGAIGGTGRSSCTNRSATGLQRRLRSRQARLQLARERQVEE